MRQSLYLIAAFMFCCSGYSQIGTYSLSSYANFATAMSSLGTSVPATLHIDVDAVLPSGTVMVTPNISLKFYNGAEITIPNGAVLTINGSIDAGLFQIFKCTGTGKVNGDPKIDQTYPDWWKDASDTYWTKAIQSAVDFYPKIFFAPRHTGQEYLINDSIRLDCSKSDYGYVLSGVGRASVFSNYGTAALTDYLFVCINIPTTGYDAGLTFENLAFFCHACGGIGIVSPSTSFSGSTAEDNIVRNVKITNCIFRRYNQSGFVEADNSQIAIRFKKVFDSNISNNSIWGFGTGIRLEASDINSIRDNRIMDIYRYGIADMSFVTFGSQNTITHNDMLSYKGTDNKGAFIKSNSRHIIIRDNYLENQPPNGTNQLKKIFAYIDCSKYLLLADIDYQGDPPTGGSYFIKHMDITGNRCDVADNTCASHIYYLSDKFKSLNLVEPPNISAYTLGSTFCSHDNPGTPVERIPLKIESATDWDKVINIDSESFKGWEKFSSSRYFKHSANGDIIIDPTNISFVSNRGEYAQQVYNSRSFLLEKDQAIFIKIDQKLDALFGDLPKTLNVKIKVRNYRIPPAALDTNTSDLYFSLKTSLVAAPVPLYYVDKDIPNADKDNYSVISITIPYPLTNAAANGVSADRFDPDKIYYISLAARNSTKEIKEIVLEAIPTASAAKPARDPKKDGALVPDEMSNTDQDEVTEEILRITVDNTIKTYPNPVKDRLTFDLKKGDTLKKLEIYDDAGKFIGDFTNQVVDNTVDISNLPSGTYIVKIISVVNSSQVIIKN